ncbi:MAG: PilN domain-containing protein [Methylotenera sp.]
MRALSLDYRRTHRFWHWAGITMLMLVLVGVAQLVNYYLALSNETTHLEKLTARIEHKLHPGHIAAPITIAETQQLGMEVKNANQVLLQLSLPWDQLFQAVESANSDNVALLGIGPDSKRGLIKVSGEAKDFDALLGYIRTLQASDFFTGVYLQHHQVQEQNPDKPIRFILDASWTGRR